MSKTFTTQVIQESAGITAKAAREAADALIAAIVAEMKKEGGFTLPSFGTFKVAKTKARKGLNPKTGTAIRIKAGKTVRFKASPVLRKSVSADSGFQPVRHYRPVLREPIGQRLGKRLLDSHPPPPLTGQPAALLVHGERHIRVEVPGNHHRLRPARLTTAAW